MGESKHNQKTALAQATEAMVVDTLGGRPHVRWDETAQATPNAQLVFFPNSRPQPTCSIAGCQAEAQELYGDLYCQQGEAENRIKEARVGLFATRTSCQHFQSNQLRMLLAALGYVLIERLRALALQGTALASAQVDTPRIKLLKVAAVVTRNTRCICLHLASSWPSADNLPACLIGMEACGSAYYWARNLQGFGHTVKLMAPQFAKPYVRTNKNDAADAEAICEAVSRPNMRFVPIKNVEQQAVLALHRVRQGFVKARTAQANQIRGLLGEFGLIGPQGIGHISARVPELIEDASNELPGSFRILVQRLLDHLKEPGSPGR